MPLAIYGLGGFGREVASFAKKTRQIIFLSDIPGEVGTVVNSIPVYDLDGSQSLNDLEIVIAVANAAVRRKLAEKCEQRGLAFGTLTADSHQRGDNTQVGHGGIYCGFTSLTADLRIGRHFHCNIYSYIAHDCNVGDFVTVAPRVCINGNTIIEDDVYIGTGAILKQGTPGKPLRIGKGATIGMGAVVTKDVGAGEVVVGNPARPVVRR